ncbi:Hemocyte protein-glutamine gamma-glutamyltransferase [Orchesella cincta]|uniref:Hemocyte protein-glutamine gamma-glutamyltransferase n=1 Tax=Orchesella cincta TaxID=48709 RepID=A0A1D2N8Q4_ORCCI|nr:Hemocyte protein-glutamine gamma-glutamyltransferase [Orchesella cincta]
MIDGGDPDSVDAATGRAHANGGRRGAAAPLKIGGVTFYPNENGKNHRTSKFQLVERGTPILRRGQNFFIALLYAPDQSRKFDPAMDQIKLIFSFGPHPSPTNGTEQILKVEKVLHSDEARWSARIKGYDKNAMTLEVRTGADSCVGIWKCRVETTVQNTTTEEQLTEKFTCPDDIYLLFNPWDSNDVTRLKEKELLNEYVLEDTGKIWVGPHTSTRGRHWVFGQFDDSVLPLVMILLEKSGIAFSSRGNPILVSRALSKIVNSNDDNGLLMGRWDGEYGDGTAPSAWTGSVPIIEQYFQSMQPVRYGQCWVFSGVLCTLCRAIGIPCRVVTNLVSAHDANGTLTIDRYFDETKNEIDYDPHNPSGSKDSIWNFHVWNDVWFARPDLPKGYGGWQAIDSTPQETSEGVFQCGPAPLEAVRKGRVGYSYDVGFVLAEVNADLVRWLKDKSKEFGFSRMEANKYHVGRQILTKKPNVFDSDGDSDRMDIIEEYKPKEGSRTERLQLVNAVRGSNRPCAPHFLELDPKEEDVEFDLIELEEIPVGDPVPFVVTITNKSSEPRTVQADLSVESMYYTGVRASIVKKASGKFSVQPNAKEELKMTVQPDDYMGKLVEYGIMKLFVICVVDETHQAWSDEDDFQVVKPPMKIEVSPGVKAGKPAYVTFSFKNPIQLKLTNCVINFEGPFLSRFSSIKHKDIEIEEELRYTHRFIPKSAGSQRLVATFSSKELIDIVGSSVIEVA